MAFVRRWKGRDTTASSSQPSQLVMTSSRPGLDGSIAPSLAAKSLDLQSKEVFHYMVHAIFPQTFATFADRVNPNWIDFIRNHQAAQSAPIEKGIRCINTWYLGMKNQDQEKIDSSRYIYGQGLRFLGGLIRNPRTRASDTTLATATLLGVFEMLDGLGPNSWLVHSRGIAELIRLRGPGAVRDGFGRTLFTTYRSFLLVDAFQRKEPCFLEEPEWRTAIREGMWREERLGKGSWIGKVTEQAFSELCLGPGFLSRTTAVIDGRPEAGVPREELISRIQNSRSALRQIQRQLASVSGMEAKLKETEKLSHINGPIPVDFVHNLTKSSLQGVCSGLALLDQLLTLLEADKQRVLHQGGGFLGAWGSGPSQAFEFNLDMEAKGHDRPLDWLDQIAMSMGTLALKDIG